jgi:hypothetical protein
VIHPDDLAATTASWGAAAEGRSPYDLEHRIRAVDGTYRWFKTRGTPVGDAAGRTIKWFGACTDIQDIVEARNTLARSREQLELMVDDRTRELAAATPGSAPRSARVNRRKRRWCRRRRWRL